jgi:Uma2 family endonuclease
MSLASPQQQSAIVYPDSDGEPMAENTVQYRWIVTIKEGIDELFEGDPNVFVAADLFWYPVEGDPHTRVAPDVLVAFGRPKGDRLSYMQWVEEGIPPQVVFEILSPSNRGRELARKLLFYERFGVEEYYTYDPDTNELAGWQREGGKLVKIAGIQGWISPRLMIRFELADDTLRITRPDGRRFLTYREQTHRAEAERRGAELERQRAEVAERDAEAERQRAEAERQRADGEAQRAEAERQRAERLLARLRELGEAPDA